MWHLRPGGAYQVGSGGRRILQRLHRLPQCSPAARKGTVCSRSVTQCSIESGDGVEDSKLPITGVEESRNGRSDGGEGEDSRSLRANVQGKAMPFVLRRGRPHELDVLAILVSVCLLMLSEADPKDPDNARACPCLISPSSPINLLPFLPTLPRKSRQMFSRPAASGSICGKTSSTHSWSGTCKHSFTTVSTIGAKLSRSSLRPSVRAGRPY